MNEKHCSHFSLPAIYKKIFTVWGEKPNKLEQVSFSETQTRKHKHSAKSCSYTLV